MRKSSHDRSSAWRRWCGVGKRGRRAAAKLRHAVFNPETLEARMLLSFSAHLTAPQNGSLNAAYTIDLWTTGGTASKWVVNWGDGQLNTYTNTPFLNPQAETHTYTSAPTAALTATATLSTNSFVTSKAAFALSPHFGSGEDYTGSGQTVYSPPSSSPTNNVNAPGQVMVVGGGGCNGGNFIYVASPYNGNELSVTRFSAPSSTTMGGVVDLAWGGNQPGVSQGTFVLPQFGSGGTEVDTPTAMYFDTTDGNLILVGQVKITLNGVTTYSWGIADLATSSGGSIILQTNAGLPSGTSPALKPTSVIEDDVNSDEQVYIAGTNGTNMVAVSIQDDSYSGTPIWTKVITGASGANTIVPSKSNPGDVVLGGFTTYTACCSCCSCCGCCGTYTASDFTLVRLAESDGSFDNTFGFHGIVRTNFGCLMCSSCCGCCSSPSFDSDYSLLEWQDVNSGTWYLIAVGSSNVFGSDQFALARYKASNGALNTGFGPYGNGLAVPSVGGDAYAAALEGSGNGNSDVSTDPNAQIVAAGSNGADFVVARLTNSATGGGSLDTTFGNAGVFLTDFGSSSASSNDIAHSIAILTNGTDDGATDILVGGSTDTNKGQIAIADYQPKNRPTIT